MKSITFEEAQKIVKQGELATAEQRRLLQKERLHILVDYERENSLYLKELYKDLPENYELSDLPVMEIRGRIWESFTIGGKNFSTKGLEVKAKFCKGLCQYQFVQTDGNSMEIRGIVAAGYDKAQVLDELAKNINVYFTEAGCENINVTYSEEPLLHNAKDGKTPMYKRI